MNDVSRIVMLHGGDAGTVTARIKAEDIDEKHEFTAKGERYIVVANWVGILMAESLKSWWEMLVKDIKPL